MNEKTHYRKAFNSPYLSSADIVDPVQLTIKCVRLESDKTKKTKDLFNTAYFVEPEIRQGEKLKPMILNATNSRMLKDITGSPYIDDWQNISVTVLVDHNVRMMGETVEGLRIHPPIEKIEVTPDNKKVWDRAVAAYIRDGNFDAILSHATITEANMNKIMEAANVARH